MKIRTLISFALLSTLTACGGDADAAAGPIAGNWTQETGTDAKGITVEFDGKSDQMQVHTAPDADGNHEHVKGTYTFDAATKAVTVKCPLLGPGKGDTWQGKIDGEHLTVTSGETKLTFHKGGDAHAHK